MSKVKKALDKIIKYREYYAADFLVSDLFRQWASKQIIHVKAAMIEAIQDVETEDSYFELLLKSNPEFMNVILNNKNKDRIAKLYTQNPDYEAAMTERKQNVIIKKMYDVCDQYKDQLFKQITKETKSKEVTFSLLHEDSFHGLNDGLMSATNIAKVQPKMLKKDLSESAQMAFGKYKTVGKLQAILFIPDEAPIEKIKMFSQRLESESVKESLSAHRDDLTKKLVQTLRDLISSIWKSFQFFRTKGEVVAQELSESANTISLMARR